MGLNVYKSSSGLTHCFSHAVTATAAGQGHISWRGPQPPNHRPPTTAAGQNRKASSWLRAWVTVFIPSHCRCLATGAGRNHKTTPKAVAGHFVSEHEQGHKQKDCSGYG
jgi:hypothetical protein